MNNETEIAKCVAAFAKHGILFTNEEIDAVFFWHTKKLHNLIGELKDEQQITT